MCLRVVKGEMCKNLTWKLSTEHKYIAVYRVVEMANDISMLTS